MFPVGPDSGSPLRLSIGTPSCELSFLNYNLLLLCTYIATVQCRCRYDRYALDSNESIQSSVHVYHHIEALMNILIMYVHDSAMYLTNSHIL